MADSWPLFIQEALNFQNSGHNCSICLTVPRKTLSDLICSKHDHKEKELHCENCKTNICVLCVPTHHKHTMISLDDLRKKRSKCPNNTKEMLSQLVPEYETRIRQLKVAKRKCQHEADKHIQQLKEHGEQLLFRVNSYIAILQKGIEREAKRNIQEYTSEERSLTTALSQINEHIKDIGIMLTTYDALFYQKALKDLQISEEGKVMASVPVVQLSDITMFTESHLVGELNFTFAPCSAAEVFNLFTFKIEIIGGDSFDKCRFI